MYLTHIWLENAGPIERLELDLPFDDDRPQPVIFVGENGTGKSIILAYVVNAILSLKQAVYENVEVEKGKVYKVRSPAYIRSGSDFTFSKLRFSNDITVGEWQLSTTKKLYEETLKSTPLIKDWQRIPEEKTSAFWHGNANNKKIEEAFEAHTYLFFPANRFEEPGWLNILNLQEQPKFLDAQRMAGWTERSVLAYSRLSKLKNWLLELLFDRSALERQVKPNPTEGQPPLFLGFSGRATNFLQAVEAILDLIFPTTKGARIGVGAIGVRDVAIMDKESDSAVAPNIASLSTGESLLLFLGLSILMDFEMTHREFNDCNDVKGIVVIDEIDLHLHVRHLRETLPKLLRMFPKVQFVVTTHSPLFLLGMQQEYGVDGFHMLEMPTAKRITAERFKEFETAFKCFKDTGSFASEIDAALQKDATKPVLFVEGESDIVLLRTAWKKRRAGEMPFVLANGHGRAQIAVMFKDEDALNKSKNRVVIGLWDFDEAFNDWYGVKFTTVIEQDSTGLTKKHKQLNRYAVLLPVPANRANLASKLYGIKSRMPIELLFSDEVLGEHNNLAQEPVLGGGTVPAFQGSKMAFAERAAEFDADEFANFDPLFLLIERIIAGEIQAPVAG